MPSSIREQVMAAGKDVLLSVEQAEEILGMNRRTFTRHGLSPTKAKGRWYRLSDVQAVIHADADPRSGVRSALLLAVAADQSPSRRKVRELSQRLRVEESEIQGVVDGNPASDDLIRRLRLASGITDTDLMHLARISKGVSVDP